MAYSGGWTPGMAPHIIDLPIWALDLGFPHDHVQFRRALHVRDAGDARTRRKSSGSIPDFTHDLDDVADQQLCLRFRARPARSGGWASISTASTARCTPITTCYKVVPEGDADEGPARRRPQSIAPSPGHEREWLDSIKTRKQPSCYPDYHCKVDVPLVLANLLR